MKRIMPILFSILFIAIALWSWPLISDQLHRQKWNDLPEDVYQEICLFERSRDSKCTRVIEFPNEILGWSPNILSAVQEGFNTNGATPCYVQNGSNEYLMIWFKEPSKDSCEYVRFWVNHDGVWNFMTAQSGYEK